MNDDGTRGPLASCAFILVDPPSVIQPALAGKQLRIPVRIVVQHHQDLALQVHALEVVPLVFRRLNTVTDEDELSVIDTHLVVLLSADGDVVIGPFEIHARMRRLKAPRLRASAP